MGSDLLRLHCKAHLHVLLELRVQRLCLIHKEMYANGVVGQGGPLKERLHKQTAPMITNCQHELCASALIQHGWHPHGLYNCRVFLSDVRCEDGKASPLLAWFVGNGASCISNSRSEWQNSFLHVFMPPPTGSYTHYKQWRLPQWVGVHRCVCSQGWRGTVCMQRRHATNLQNKYYFI